MDITSKKENSDLGVSFDVPLSQIGKTGTPSSSGNKKSHLTNHEDVFDVTKVFQSKHGGDAGTIISDRKRHRPSFGETLQSAFSEWWSGAKVTIEKAVATVAVEPNVASTVASARTRTEVVNEAVKHSTIPPRDDHQMVLEQFHTYKSDLARISGTPNVVIKQPSQKSVSSSWSHTTGEIVPVTEPKKNVPPLDFRGSMIAPDVTRKIKTDVRDYVRHTVPQERVVPKAPVVVTVEPERVAVTPIPNVVRTFETTVPQERVVPKAPVVVTVEPVVIPPAVPHTTSPLPASSEKRSQPIFVAPPERNAKPLSSPPSVEKVVPEIKTFSTEEVHEVALPEFVKPPQEEHRRYEPTQSRTIEPIQTSDTTHVFHAPRPHAQEKKRTEKTDDFSFYLSLINTVPKTAWIALGGVTLGVLLIASGIGMYVSFFKSAPIQTYSITSYFSVDTPVGIPLTEDRSAFHSVFTEQLSASGAKSVQVYPTLRDGESLRPATSKEFFDTLAMHLPRTLENALDSGFMIGGITTTSPEPFLIIRSYNFDTLFSGLLDWEDTMPEDLAPLFGEPVATSTHFTDAVQNNKSTRILYDTAGNEVLLYSFISQNVVIITTSGGALSRLIQEF